MDTNRGFKLAPGCSSIQKPTVKKAGTTSHTGSLWSKFSCVLSFQLETAFLSGLSESGPKKKNFFPSNAMCQLVDNKGRKRREMPFYKKIFTDTTEISTLTIIFTPLPGVPHIVWEPQA